MNAIRFAGILSGILSVTAFLPYILDMLTGRTRPQRASWLIWSVLSSIAFCSQVYEGASDSLWFAGIQASGTLVIFMLSIALGAGRFIGRGDGYLLAAAAFGLVLWHHTDNAGYALAITISISLLGGVATVMKAYREPDSETMATWAISLVAAFLAVLSVGKTDPVLLAYPVYLITLKSAIVSAILLGRMKTRPARVVLVAA